MRNLKRMNKSMIMSLSLILMTGITTMNLNNENVFCLAEAYQKGDTAYVDVNALNVRKDAGTNYKKITTIYRGTKVSVLAKSSNGWTRIETSSGKKGYVYTEYLTDNKAKNNTNQSTNKSKVPKEKLQVQFQAKVNTGKGDKRLVVRRTAKPNGTKIGSLKNRATINVFGMINGWYKVCVNGEYGWADMRFFELKTDNKKGRSIEESLEIEEVVEDTEIINDISRLRKNELLTVTTKGGEINLREKASSKSSVQVLGRLDNGSKLEALDQDGDWVKVKVVQSKNVTKDKEGWVHLKFINHGEFINAEGYSRYGDDVYGIVNTKSSRLNVRESDESDAPIIGQLDPGAQVKLYRYSDGWSKVFINGKYGWVSEEFLRVETTEDGSAFIERNR